MMAKNATKHLCLDRADRTSYILTHIPLGEVYREWIEETNRGIAKKQLTNTGVVIIRNQDNFVITMYIATMHQIAGMFHGEAPSWLVKIARTNKKFYNSKEYKQYG